MPEKIVTSIVYKDRESTKKVDDKGVEYWDSIIVYNQIILGDEDDFKDSRAKVSKIEVDGRHKKAIVSYDDGHEIHILEGVVRYVTGLGKI